MTEVDLQVGDRLNCYVGIDFGEALVERGDLRIDRERGPRQWIKTNFVKKVRVGSAIVRIPEIDVEISFELEPGNVVVVPPCLQPIADADAPDRPTINGIDGGELRKIDWQ